MIDDRMAELYKTQQSLTEWMQDINHKNTSAMRLEDNEKRERLKVLKTHLGMPFDEPTKFEATDLRDNTEAHKKHLQKHGEELCALRLIPKKPDLPKLRMRGRDIKGAYEWFFEQEINAEDYRAEYMPHTETSRWSTIFVVNKHGIQGEIINGGHYQLTQGFFDSGTPIMFSFDFKEWQISDDRKEVKEELLKIISHLHVPDKNIQAKLKEELDATFVQDYLCGYFETVDTDDFGLWFVDYNRVLGEMFADATFTKTDTSKAVVSGQIGCQGQGSGVVQIVHPDKIDVDFPDGGVLVCEVTTPAYVPLMQKAVAIVTDQGGILSHAAIVARELKKPCIVGTGDATKKLSNGQKVLVDAQKGSVTIK